MKNPLSFHSITRRVTGGRVTPRASRLLATLAMLGAATPALAGAQSIGIQVGDSARVVVNPGATVQVPLRVDLSAAGALNIASLNGNLGVTGSGLVATGWSVASNEASTGLVQTQGNLAAGSRLLSYFSATRLAATATLGTASFTATSTMGSDSYKSALIRYAVTSAGTEAGTNLSGAQLSVRNMRVCVPASSVTGRWGDVNDDASVTIADAQQIARYSVSLTSSLDGDNARIARADVTADGATTIVDAQQIARWTVGLSAAARINTSAFTEPTATAATLTASVSTIAAGNTLQLDAEATRAGTNPGDVTGCVPLTYSSSNPSIATISSDGLVTGVSAGTALMTVTAGSQTGAPTATYSVTVSQPYHLFVATAPSATGTSNALLATQPVIQVRTAAGGAGTLVTEPRTVTVALTDGGGALSGTTSVTTVGGVATFTDLALTGADGAKTVTYSSSGITSASSVVTLAAPTNMRLLVGAAPTQQFTSGTDVTIPLILDLDGRGTGALANLASISTTISWDPARFTYVSNTAGNWVDELASSATVNVNAAGASAGTLQISGFTTSSTTTSGRILRNITLRPAATGPYAVTAVVNSAANEAGNAVTVVPRNLGSASAGGGSSAPVATVTVSPGTVTDLAVGTTRQFSAVLRDASGNVLTGRTVTWSSSNAALATVSSSGLVTGVAAGIATITATSEGINGTASVTVIAATAVPVASVTLTPATGTVTVGGPTLQLTATVRDASGNVLTRSVSYSSSDETAATVSGAGVVTPVAASANPVTITATSGGVAGTAAITVTAASPLGTGFGSDQFSGTIGGQFTMGSLTGNENERPVRTVTVSNFRIQKSEVTRRQWQAVMGASWTNPGAAGCNDLDCPVSGVSYAEVTAFLSRLNDQIPGQNFRLPTEAQWEYAARAGGTGDYGTKAGPSAGTLDEMGWWSGNSAGRARPVGTKTTSNFFGLYDMTGNVDEWVSDWLAFYDPAALNNPTGPSSGTARILRGGSWGSSAFASRVSFRYWVPATEAPVSGGFRLVRNPNP